MEFLLLVAQTVLVGLLAGWLVIGAFENIRAPSVNRDLVRDVFGMQSMGQDFPEIHTLVKRNRMKSEGLQSGLFTAIVVLETVVAAALSLATIMLLLAVIGIVPAAIAVLVAGWATLGFILIWGLFLVGGNWFHYWVSHQGSQHTHYLMTIWGIITLLVLFQ